MSGVQMPEAELFTHELISNGGGVYLGVTKRGICEQAYYEGETSEVIQEWVLRSTLKAYGDAHAKAALELAIEQITVLKEGWGDAAEECGMSTAITTIHTILNNLK